MRTVEHSRVTKETKVSVKLSLDGTGKTEVSTGVAFFDHLMRTLGTHSRIDLDIIGIGDLKHHIVEDVAITMGEAIRKALGDGTGIQRFGYAIVPMDDALAIGAVDLVSRPFAKIDLKMVGVALEDANMEDILHFLETLAMSLRANIHLNVQNGSNDHHKVEAAFKALALSLRQAVAISPGSNEVPSAKGAI